MGSAIELVVCAVLEWLSGDPFDLRVPPVRPASIL
jgi:hypothetical protein